MADEIDINAQLEVELTPFATLDLDEAWIAYLSESAEVPTTVEGVDPGIDYRDDGTETAYA